MKFGQLQQDINIPFSMHILRLCRIDCGKSIVVSSSTLIIGFFLGMNNDTAHTATTPSCLPRKYGKCYENTLTVVHVKRLNSDAVEGPTKFGTFQTLYFI